MANTERIPDGIHNAIDYEYRAPEVLGAQRFAYIAGGSGLDVTVAANRSAFGRWASVPRLLRDVRGGHSRLQLADMALPHPFVLAPVAHGLLAEGVGRELGFQCHLRVDVERRRLRLAFQPQDVL